ncbi:MAG: hypothetical protein ACREOO_18510 [bacterium]
MVESRKTPARHKIFYGFILIALGAQLLGLIFCGDADCLQGGPNQDCAALICGLLGKHSSTNPASEHGANDSCQCFCHVLIDLPKTSLQSAILSAASLQLVEIFHFFSTPVRDIDHPPLA